MAANVVGSVVRPRAECPLCETSLLAKDVVKHVQRKHEGGLELTDAQVEALQCVRCLLCLRIVKGLQGLQRHVDHVHKDYVGGKHAALCAATLADSDIGRRVRGEQAALPLHGNGPAAGGEAKEAEPNAAGMQIHAGANEAAGGQGAQGAVPAGSGPFLTLGEVARLPPHRTELGKGLRALFVAAVDRIVKLLEQHPRNERLWKLFFALPKLGLAGYHGKGWRKAAERILVRFPDVSAAELELARQWRPPARRVAVAGADLEEMSRQDRIIRAVRAAEAGSVQKAAQALWGAKLAQHDEEVLGKLAALHPQEPVVNARVGEMPAAPTAPSVTEEWERAARALPRYSAPGPSGWTYELIRMCIEDLGDGFCRILKLLVDGWWRGDGLLRDWWLAARLIALSKGGGGVRPIACADAFYRFAMRLLLERVDVTSLLPSWQLGVRVKGGIEAVVHALRQRLRAGMRVVELDFSNAFNRMSRRRMLAALEKLADRSSDESAKASARLLVRAVRYAYGQHSPLLVAMDDGSVREVSSSSGVRQGDPLSMLLFAIGLNEMLHESGVLNAEGVLPLAIVDDVYLALPKFDDVADDEDADEPRSFAARRRTAIEGIQGVSPQWGMELNLDKCRDLDLHQMEAIREARRVLGAFLGDAAAAKANTAEEFQTWSERLNWLDDLPKQVALLLMRWVILAGVGHLLRLMPPSATKNAARQFDQALRDKVASWTRKGFLTVEEEANLRMAVRYDGLGIRALESVADDAYAASLLAARVTLEAHNVAWLQVEGTSSEDRSAMRHGATVLSSTVPRMRSVDKGLVPHAQKALTAARETSAWLTRTADAVEAAKAARTAAADAEEATATADAMDLALGFRAEQTTAIARAWTRALPTLADGTRLSDDEVLAGIEVRLGAAPTAAAVSCACGVALGLGDDISSLLTRHALACPRSQQIRTRRHDVVLSVLEKAWVKAGHEVRVEQRVDPVSGEQRSDVLVVVDDNERHIDVAVVTTPMPAGAGVRWPSTAMARVAAAALTGLSPELATALRDVTEARKVIVQDRRSGALESTRLPSKMPGGGGAGAGAGAPAVQELVAEEALKERLDIMEHHGDRFVREVVETAEEGSLWHGLAVHVTTALGQIAAEDDGADGGVVAEDSVELGMALARPHDAARRFADKLAEAPLRAVLAAKAADKRARDREPAVLSAFGLAEGSFKKAWPRHGSAGLELSRRNVRLSCALLRGAAMCFRRFNEAVEVHGGGGPDLGAE